MPIVHIIGAGISGLAAASALAERRVPVNLYESLTSAGGRARPQTPLRANTPLDSGIHRIGPTHRQSHQFLQRIGASAQWEALRRGFHFTDIRNGAQWDLLAPKAPLVDYLAPVRMLANRRDVPIADVIDPFHPLYEYWAAPLSRITLGAAPEEASAQMFAQVLRSHLRGAFTANAGHVPRRSLQAALIAPALHYLESQGISTYYGHSLTRMEGDGRISRLVFTRKPWSLGPKDVVILATPPHVSAHIDPAIPAPPQQQAIITLHYFTAHREADHRLLGLVGAAADYVLFRPEHIVAVCHVADHLLSLDGETLAVRFWSQLRKALPYLPQTTPPFQMLKERHGGFASLPDTPRPPTQTRHPNLFLAGDHVAASHLPACIESAVSAGHHAAEQAWRALK